MFEDGIKVTFVRGKIVSWEAHLREALLRENNQAMPQPVRVGGEPGCFKKFCSCSRAFFIAGGSVDLSLCSNNLEVLCPTTSHTPATNRGVV